MANAFWISAPGVGELRPVTLPEPGAGEVRVRALCSGISRGTETLVFRGEVPLSQYARMRAPFQQGDFPGPLTYGYLSVGVLANGQRVFCLHPHQTDYVVPATAVTSIPDDVPSHRAVLAGTVETAINALWDAPPLLGDRVSVVGAGMVGGAVAALLAMLSVEVELVDTDPARAALAAALGVGFAAPDRAATERDLVIHASATGAGLQTSLRLAAPEATVLELSWYGDRPVTVALGESFHSRRLRVRASQVGTVAHPRRTAGQRLALALDRLRDDRFDALLDGTSPFAELPRVLATMAAGGGPRLCHVITYGDL